MKLFKCQSCGASLRVSKCDHCGAYHHGTFSGDPQYLVHPDTAEKEIEAVTGMYRVMYGWAAIRPELIVRLK